MKNPIPHLQTSHDVARATAQLREDHERAKSPLQRVVDRFTAGLARPGIVAALTVAIIAWCTGNLLAVVNGAKPWDSPPFAWLEVTVATAALYVSILILTAQRREDRLSSQREQLILELTILNDQKLSKIIELLEEARTDNPLITNQVDGEAQAMKTPADIPTVADAIKEIDNEHD